jgi:hypothetical protein
MLASAPRMSNMIDGVLAYSSMNAESPQNGLVNLNAVLQDIASDLEVVMQQKQATLTVHELPAIEGNRFLLHQLFYNLVNNAFKFAKADKPSIVTIACQAQGDTVRITVQDNGIGFEQSYAEKIFEAFFRLNSKDRYEGTGLGLSLCRKIVVRHQARFRPSEIGVWALCLSSSSRISKTKRYRTGYFLTITNKKVPFPAYISYTFPRHITSESHHLLNASNRSPISYTLPLLHNAFHRSDPAKKYNPCRSLHATLFTTITFSQREQVRRTSVYSERFQPVLRKV